MGSARYGAILDEADQPLHVFVVEADMLDRDVAVARPVIKGSGIRLGCRIRDKLPDGRSHGLRFQGVDERPLVGGIVPPGGLARNLYEPAWEYVLKPRNKGPVPLKIEAVRSIIGADMGMDAARSGRCTGAAAVDDFFYRHRKRGMLGLAPARAGRSDENLWKSDHDVFR